MLHVLGWRWKRTSPYRNLVAHVCRTQFLSQDPARCFSRKYSPKDNDDNDVIEAEIINDKTIDKDSGPHMTSSSWGISDVGNFLSHGFNKAKEVIGMDEKSIRKRQARKKMDAEIDKALRGTGQHYLEYVYRCVPVLVVWTVCTCTCTSSLFCYFCANGYEL